MKRIRKLKKHIPHFRKIKAMKKLLLILLVIIITQSCKDRIAKEDGHTKVYGTITDKNTGGLLKGIKLEVKISKWDNNIPFYEDTEYSTQTNEKGYYELEYPNIKGQNKLVPVSDDYTYTEGSYKPIVYNNITEINLKLVKRGKVKIEGVIMHRTPEQNFLLENVKISVLKRSIGNANYPETTGIETFTDSEGKYYIEYEGDKNYNFFLKPEKEGYYYEYHGEFDYKEFPNLDPSYVISGGFSLEKENK